MEHRQTFLQSFSNTIFSQIATALITQPMDMILTLAQVDALPKASTMFRSIVKVVSTEGVLSLYRGAPVKCLQIFPCAVIVLVSSSVVRVVLDRYNPRSQFLLFAFRACLLFSKTLTYVFIYLHNELIFRNGDSALFCLWNTIRTEGVHGIYRGFDALLLCELAALVVSSGVRKLCSYLPRPDLADAENDHEVVQVEPLPDEVLQALENDEELPGEPVQEDDMGNQQEEDEESEEDLFGSDSDDDDDLDEFEEDDEDDVDHEIEIPIDNTLFIELAEGNLARMHDVTWKKFLSTILHTFTIRCTIKLCMRVVVYPGEVICRVMQFHRVGFIQALTMIRKTGPLGFYRGFSLDLIQIPISVAVGMGAIFVLTRYNMYVNGYTSSLWSAKPVPGVPTNLTPDQLYEWKQTHKVHQQ